MSSSLSIFARPTSPPPRAVSPELVTSIALNPLPLPPMRSKKSSSDRFRAPPKPVLRTTPSRGILKPTPPSSPSSASFSSPSSSSRASLTHRRSLQFAIPYRSPPASPTLASPPPPVPPIPAFVLDSPAPPRNVVPTTLPRPQREPSGGISCSRFMSMSVQGSQLPGPGRRNVAPPTSV